MKNLTRLFHPRSIAIVGVPRGFEPGRAILSRSGGPAIAAADACEEYALQVAELQAQSREQLRAILPKTGKSGNDPVDLGLKSVFEIDLYGRVAACVGLVPGMEPLIIRKPFMVISFGGIYREQQSVDALIKARIPVYPSAERAIWAYANLSRYAEKQFHG